MSKFSKILTVISSVSLTIFIIFILVLGRIDLPMSETGLIPMLALYFCGLLPLGTLASFWLVWINREYVANVFVWSLFQLLFAALMKFYAYPAVALLFSSLLFILFPLVGFVDFLFAYKKNLSLRFMAWGSIFFMWSILAAWKITGDLLEAWVQTMFAETSGLWWLQAAMYGSAWAVAAGLLAFVVETIVVLRKEFAAR